MFEFASVYSLILLGIALFWNAQALMKLLPEKGLKNGLQSLWKLLVADLITALILVGAAFLIIGTRYILSLDNYRILSFILLIIFSTVVFVKSYVKKKMYFINFSSNNKAMYRHEKTRLRKAGK